MTRRDYLEKAKKIYQYLELKLKNIPYWSTREKDHPAYIRYSIAVLFCIVALILKKIFEPILGHELPFMLFYSSILLSAWYGGFKPGILATLLSSIFAFFSFLGPSALSIPAKIIALILFVSEGLIIAVISNSMHKAFQKYEEKDRYLRYYASIAQNISDAVISTDINDNIQSWNKGAEALYGWNQQDVIGKPLHTIIPAMYTIHQKKEMQDDLFSKGMWKDEVSHKRKNGSRMYVLTSMSLIRDENQKPLGIVSVNRDISDRKKIEQGKDDFIALASHELKTPLTSTKLFVDILKQRFELTNDKKSQMYLSKISSQVHKLHELVNYLLDVSKVQAGKMQFTMEEIAVDRFVADVVRDVQQITPSHRFRIQGKTEAHITIDKDRIRQVIVNILNNAVKYSSNAHEVIVDVSQRGARIRISITDFGIGIPKEKRDKIFDRFYQVNDAKGYTYSGMGLGLYISKDIIEKHNGTLSVESEEGKGSTFFIELPLSTHH